MPEITGQLGQRVKTLQAVQLPFHTGWVAPWGKNTHAEAVTDSVGWFGKGTTGPIIGTSILFLRQFKTTGGLR